MAVRVITHASRLTCAVDCGRVVNPRIVQAQIEGGALFGLAALRQSISIDGGRVSQSNFHDVPLIRMSKAPAVEVHIVESSAAPTCAGEPVTPPAIPAVLNALAAATGKRIRNASPSRKGSIICTDFSE